jgi:lipoyltransferase 1
MRVGLNFFRNFQIARQISSRGLTSIAQLIPEKEGSLALFSLSNNIYYNLALENYLAESVNSINKNILLMWISEPCIVFGRHQNPWLECNVNESTRRNVKLARRYSGGGCVYHDLGNLNISFITNRLKFDRKWNLNLIKETLLDNFELNDGVQIEITPRHDIFLSQPTRTHENDAKFKITGSAARLSQKFSYHHCTLLCDTNMVNMKLLRSNLEASLVTKATPSVRSKCINLKQATKPSARLEMTRIVEKLCEKFWQSNFNNWSIEHLFNYVQPESEPFVAILDKSVRELEAWDYVFGLCPNFKLNVGLGERFLLVLDIQSGIIKGLKITNTSKTIESDAEIDAFRSNLINELINNRFEASVIATFLDKNQLNFETNVYFIGFKNFMNKNFL